MKDVKLIKLKPEQWEMYKKLRLKSLLSDPIAFATTYQAVVYSDEEWKKKLHYPGSIFVFAKQGKKLIGMLGIYTQGNGQASGIAIIVGVYVDPIYRGQGIGKLLMAKALKEIKKHKEVAKVKVWVSETQKPAIELYKSVGFKPAGKKKEEIFFKGKYFDELIMEKELL